MEGAKFDWSSYGTFGELLTALKRERGIVSDDDLAKKVSKRGRYKVSGHTIGNWSNGSPPSRGKAGAQAQLGAVLEVDRDPELARVWRELLRAAYRKPDIGSPNKTTVEVEPRHEGSPIPGLAADATNSDQRRSPPASVPRVEALSHTRVIGFGAIVLALSLAGLLASRIVGDREFYRETIPPSALRLSLGGFVLPQSSERHVDDNELRELSGWELYVARNEIYARHGRQFTLPTSKCLQAHFNSWKRSPDNPKGWYVPVSGMPLPKGVEIENAERIRNFECTVRGGQYTCNGLSQGCERAS